MNVGFYANDRVQVAYLILVECCAMYQNFEFLLPIGLNDIIWG